MTELRLGYACDWDGAPARVWSGTALALRQSLQQHAEVTDLHCEPESVGGRLLRRLVREGARRGFVEPWPYSRLQALYATRRLRAQSTSQLDAVLQLNDVGRVSAPSWLYQDLNYATIGELREQVEPHLLDQGGLGAGALRRRREAEVELFARARGVFVMSAWLRDRLVAQGLQERDRIHVVGAGINVPVVVPAVRSDRTPNRVLFVGREFVRKGGDLVLQAVAELRRRRPGTTLTVIGPLSLARDVPAFVDFRGPQDAVDVSAALREHDVLAMPSRFEAYGIVLAEALVQGLPCVARDAFAMPEIVTDGVDGVLVRSDDVADVAAALARCLDDSDLRERAWKRRRLAADKHSWDRIAAEMASVMVADRGGA